MGNLISIIVPIYKVEPYLRRCLASIVNQTYTNLEIILVDDGSPDNCPQICDEYAARDKRIIVIHKENGGLSDARNAGLNVCKGDYIFFVDSDDFITENCIEEFVVKSQGKDYDVVIAQHSHSLVANCSEKKIAPKEIISNLQIAKAFSIGDFHPCAWNKLYKARFIKSNHTTFHKGILFEDQLWSIHWVTQASSISIIPYVTYIYNTRSSSIMDSCRKNLNQSLKSWETIITEYNRLLSTSKWPVQLKQNILIQKIEESLNLVKENFSLFGDFYRRIQIIIPIQSLYGHYKTDSAIKNVFYGLFNYLPSYLFRFLLYVHIKIKQ